MYFFLFLPLLLFLVFLILIVGRQSGSIQSSRESQRKSLDAESDLSLAPTDPSHGGLQTLFVLSMKPHQNAPVGSYATDSVVVSDVSADYSSSGYSTGGELGTAFADVIDGGGSTFDNGSDFGGGGTSDGASS